MDMGMGERAAEVIQRYAEVLGRHVIPIYHDDERGRPSLLGSGLLVGTAEGSFLISAAHVLDPLRTGTTLYVHLKEKRRLFEKHFLSNTPEGGVRDDDKLDIGVLKFEDPGAPPYLADKYPVPIAALMAQAIPRKNKRYVVLGFPGSQSTVSLARKTVEAKPYAHECSSAPSERYGTLGLPEESHIVLQFNRKRVFNLKGQRQTFPEPGGMSGSPVWMMYDENGPNNPVLTPVVGILTRQPRNGQVLVATDIGFAKYIIEHAFD